MSHVVLYSQLAYQTFQSDRKTKIKVSENFWCCLPSLSRIERRPQLYTWYEFGTQYDIYVYIFSIPFIIFALLFSLPPGRNSDPGGSSPPLPTAVRALHFYREKISALPSLVDSRRIVLTHARRSQQLILSFFFIQTKSKSRYGGIRTHGPALVSFEGYHYSSSPGRPAI